tara:strand:+ start:1479 stop:2828 length:1350 start_codon:yes stop_codon:yes gene_type:complete
MVVYQFEKIVKNNLFLSSNFPTGSGKFKFLSNNKIQVIPVEDPISSKYTIGYDYYFNICVENTSKKIKEIEVKVLRNDSIKKLKWESSKAPLFYSYNKLNWFLINNIKSTNSNREYLFKIKIKSNKKLYISNNISIEPKILNEKLFKISNKNKKYIKYHKIGLSTEKKPIVALEINFNKKVKKDRFLIWSGIHPSEPDTYSSLGIINWLLSNDIDAIKIRNKFIFDIIPMINPDGFNLGTNGCNKNGVNIYWDFFKLNKKNCPESYYLWKWINLNPPQIALDFHSYIYQTNKFSRPYIFPVKFYPIQFRLPAWKFQNSIVKLCDNKALDGRTVFLKSTLGPHLIRKFGTLTLQGYHLHLAEGPDEFRKKTIQTIISIYKSINHFQPLYLKKINYYKIDLNGLIWIIFEKIFDRYPRKLINYFIKNKSRNIISLSKYWKNYQNKEEIKLY